MNWPASPEEIGFISIIGGVAIIANIAGYLMKTMIPLRLLAMATNVLFLIWSTLAGVYVTMILNTILLPINALRFFQMRRLIRQVNSAANGDLSMEWIKPFSTKKHFTAGTVLFRKGDPADELLFLMSGRFRVVEPDIEMSAGSIIGELGLLEPGRNRTATVECVESGETLAIAYDDVMQLYFQNPTFGFYFLQLSTARLFHTIRILEQENAALRAATAKPEAAVHS
jgi:hypothetical protein